MALVIVLTKVSISEPQAGMVVLIVNMTCTEDAVEVINQDFSAIKKAAISIATVRDRLQDDMQEVIDRWKREQAIFDMVQLDNAITALQIALQAKEDE